MLEKQGERLRMFLAVLIEYVDVVKQPEFEELQFWSPVCRLGDRHSWPSLLGQQCCRKRSRGKIYDDLDFVSLHHMYNIRLTSSRKHILVVSSSLKLRHYVRRVEEMSKHCLGVSCACVFGSQILEKMFVWLQGLVVHRRRIGFLIPS